MQIKLWQLWDNDKILICFPLWIESGIQTSKPVDMFFKSTFQSLQVCACGNRNKDYSDGYGCLPGSDKRRLSASSTVPAHLGSDFEFSPFRAGITVNPHNCFPRLSPLPFWVSGSAILPAASGLCPGEGAWCLVRAEQGRAAAAGARAGGQLPRDCFHADPTCLSRT